MAALKSNVRNFEAACYLGIMGFQIATLESDVEEMKLSVDNLKIAQSLYPASGDLARLIREYENQLVRRGFP